MCCTVCGSRIASSPSRTARPGCARSITWSCIAGGCSSSRASRCRRRCESGPMTRAGMSGAACTRAGRRGCPPRSSRRGASRSFCEHSWNGTGKNCSGGSRFGLRTIARLLTGKDHGGFLDAPIQLMIAVSDRGRIGRLGGWKEPQEPFPVFVTKADLVPDKIDQELERHRKGATSLGKSQGEYGLWDIEEHAAKAVAEFLAARHVERSGAAPTRMNRTAPIQDRAPSRGRPVRRASTTEAFCKHCRGKDLTAAWGKFGYYWRCGACGKTTSMPQVCSRCGAEGRRGKGVRVRKEGRTYFRDCEACGTSEVIWTEA